MTSGRDSFKRKWLRGDYVEKEEKKEKKKNKSLKEFENGDK